MKMKNQGMICAVVLAACVWAAPGLAQRAGTERGDRFSLLIEGPTDRLLERALENLEALPEELQAEVLALRDSLQSLKEAWVSDYRPGADATLGEIREARAAFESDFAAEIEANKQLRISVVSELRVELRNRFADEDWSQEARDLMQQYNEIKRQLAAEWKEAVASLGDDATREDVAAAKARFAEANAELIAQQKELAVQVRLLIRENRGNGRELADRGELPEELRALRSEIAVLRSQIRERKEAAREELKGMSREEREAYRRALLDELKDVHDDIKERRRQMIRDLGDEQDGDRRPEG